MNEFPFPYHRQIIEAKIMSKYVVLYPQFTPYPCKIKNCKHKKKNGRCKLKEIHLALKLDKKNELTGECLMFKQR